MSVLLVLATVVMGQAIQAGIGPLVHGVVPDLGSMFVVAAAVTLWSGPYLAWYRAATPPGTG